MLSSLAPGLLVAAPPLGDPNFDRSVVLLAAHGPEGAFGWIVNGKDVMTVPELLVRADVTDQPLDVPGVVRVGGPVSPEQVWLVYRNHDKLSGVEGQFDIGQGIVATASRRVLELMAEGVVPERVIGYVGYAGWAPAQLENEIKQGAWLPTDVHADLVFDVPAGEAWTKAYERVGLAPIAFTSRTVGSA
ncbi:MAG: YqgE/AlgH family protein [Polyangiaceae bacterium]